MMTEKGVQRIKMFSSLSGAKRWP